VVSLAFWPLNAVAPTEKRLQGPQTWSGHLASAGSQAPNHPAGNIITEPTMLSHLPVVTHSLHGAEFFLPSHGIPTFYRNQMFFVLVQINTNSEMWWVLRIGSSGMWCHVKGYVCTSVLQELAASIFRVEESHLRWKEKFSLKCWYSSTQIHFPEKHNLESDSCHVVISHTLTPAYAKYRSTRRSCCSISFTQLIIRLSNTCDIRKQPYLSPWIIYRLSQCSLSYC
jgi:hypothetical protein